MIAFDQREFDRTARRLEVSADQVPFAISLALNKAAAAVETRLATETWPRHTAARNRGFFKAAMDLEPATKRALTVRLVDRLGRSNLALNAKGGVARPKKGKLAIPTKAVRRGPHGVASGQKPRSIDPKRKVVKGGLIFTRVGRGKNQKLRLLYNIAASARIKKDVPLIEDWSRFMAEEVRRQIPEAMRRAMQSRR